MLSRFALVWFEVLSQEEENWYLNPLSWLLVGQILGLSLSVAHLREM
jgi:hypothetical protein